MAKGIRFGKTEYRRGLRGTLGFIRVKVFSNGMKRGAIVKQEVAAGRFASEWEYRPDGDYQGSAFREKTLDAAKQKLIAYCDA